MNNDDLITELVSPGVVSPAISSSSLEGSASVSVSDLLVYYIYMYLICY